MPRRQRDIAPGYHHAWVNATGGSEYFIDGIDRIAWVRSFLRVLNRMGWTCPGFCQMSTHVHALVSTPDRSLPLGMRDLNRQYSYEFNIRHDRIGTFLRKRYGSRRIEDGKDLLRTTAGLSNDFPFVDAADVIAEAGGSLEGLRGSVEAVVRTRLEPTRPEPGSGRVLSS